MRRMMRGRQPLGVLAAVLLLAFGSLTARAQEINLDRMVRCGSMICYPSLDEPDRYYYLPDAPRLAIEDGRPQFSFLKYARLQDTGEAGTTRAAGGGLLHFLVTYGAGEDRVADAEAALQEKFPDARIEGPIVYRKGSFALITSFREDNEEVTKTVAVGKAPLMEGQKTAVSMLLTREGAELLWESFQTDTPDISLVFDMEFAGVREPYEATLEADWARIAKHHQVSAGVKYAWFGADVDLLFQELRQTGAVKVTTKGENASMDQIIASANAKLLQVMFDPAPDELSRMAAQGGNYSNLDQAVKLLKNAASSQSSAGASKGKSGGAKKQSRLWPPSLARALVELSGFFTRDVYAVEESSQAPADNEQQAKALYKEGQRLYQQSRYADALEKFRQTEELLQARTDGPGGEIAFNIGQCLRRMERYEEAERQFRIAAERFKPGSSDHKDALQMAGQMAAEAQRSAYAEARKLDEQARQSDYPPELTARTLEAYETYLAKYSPGGERAREVEGRIRVLGEKMEGQSAGPAAIAQALDSDAGPGEPSQGKPAAAGGTSGNPQKNADARVTGKKEDPAPGKKAGASSAKSKDKKTQSAAAKAALAPKGKKTQGAAASSRADGSAGFSLVASYRMKKIKRSGRLVYQMNHFRTETQAFAMAENIGNLYRRYGSDPRVFRTVTIDDPVFKQREILVTLDGQDADTFSRYLNFVTVKMTKRHQDGQVSADEVVITPEAFSGQGNAFELSYGFKGDNDRSRWLNYQVETLWSFHGGLEVHTPRQTRSEPMLALAPPHLYRSLSIEGQGERLRRAGVRHGLVTVTSRIDGREITTQATVRNQGSAPSALLEVPVDREHPSVEAEIIWFLTGGRQVRSEVQPVLGEIIYWDEVPEKGL